MRLPHVVGSGLLNETKQSRPIIAERWNTGKREQFLVRQSLGQNQAEARPLGRALPRRRNQSPCLRAGFCLGVAPEVETWRAAPEKGNIKI